MANYGNGAFTRQAIIQACKQLFYEKGYHETSYSDICKAAHVNRSTIYYHFDSKEAMRYEVMWEYTIANKRIAERYCKQSEYLYIVAVCMMWYHIKYDERLRLFHLSGCEDYPVLTGKADYSHYYTVLYERMWGAFFDKKEISELSFASVYGYIMSCMRMLCTHPQKYDPMELFMHTVNASVSIWGISKDAMDRIWENVTRDLAAVPRENLEKFYF